MRRLTLFIFIFVLTAWNNTLSAGTPMKVIFDTDMGNDVDDTLALDMLYKYHDMGKIDLIGVVSSKRETGSIKYIDAMATLYGHADIPLGIAKTYPEESYQCTDKRLNYADYVVSRHDYHKSIADYDAVEDGWLLMRRLLAESKEREVTIIAVGFSTNLARLIDSAPDALSPLSGRELIADRVRRLVMMAGNFAEPKKEYNIYNDHTAALRVCEEWPTEILFSGFEVGHKILYPYTAIATNFGYAEHHPVVEAFNYYAAMPYNRPTWDLTAVLFAIEPSSRYFSLSPAGYVSVNQASITLFTENPKANRRYYKVNDRQKSNTLHRLLEITAQKPKSVK